MKTNNYEIKKYLVDYLQEIGSIKSTYQEIVRLYDEVKQEIKRLGGNLVLEQVMQLIDLPKDDKNN